MAGALLLVRLVSPADPAWGSDPRPAAPADALESAAPAAAGQAGERGGASGSHAGEQAPGVRIERSPPDAEARRALARLRQWRRVYLDSLAPVRRAATRLFAELERSSLATLGDRCRSLLARVDEVDRAALFPSTDVELDRMLFGSLERYRAGAAACLGGRFLASYRLLLEARAGMEWVDRRVERRLAPPVPLPGLGPPE